MEVPAPRTAFLLKGCSYNPALGSSLGLPKSREMGDVFYFGMSSIEISFFSIIPFIFNPKN